MKPERVQGSRLIGLPTAIRRTLARCHARLTRFWKLTLAWITRRTA